MVHYRVLRAVALLLLPFSLAQTTNFGPELTQAELEVQGAISPPCETNSYCVTLVNDVIPRCQKLQGDPGCWCGNHDPLHYCAICMSNPTNNETTADQTAAALDGHTKFHTLCNAFEAALNASISASAGPSSTASGIATGAASSNSGSGKAPIGAIVGGSVGGAVALIVAAVLIMLWLRRRKRSRVAPSSVSLFSEGAVSSQARPYSGYGHPQSAFGHHDGQYGGPPPESAFVPGYGPASVPYQTSGMRSPGLNSVSDGSYKKHPEPMTPAPGY